MNKILLHGEGFVVFALSLYLYGSLSFSWILFIILLLAPDLSMIGYMGNDKVGAVVYNIFHTYILSIGVAAAGMVFSFPAVLAVGLIWSAHIGMDRMIGFGLKYPESFKDTHLNRV
ncbi:DUF4260 domain-containing protein [Salibacterium aidingense]|uniref:DUF4260 domain-containing protein n=1 Tax=Salibacterium aidingense TaxID=384933 RepID=UPI00041BA51B|nr:DUF4260 domain-containing protein [Salibacterium aidingense]